MEFIIRSYFRRGTNYAKQSVTGKLPLQYYGYPLPLSIFFSPYDPYVTIVVLLILAFFHYYRISYKISPVTSDPFYNWLYSKSNLLAPKIYHNFPACVTWPGITSFLGFLLVLPPLTRLNITILSSPRMLWINRGLPKTLWHLWFIPWCNKDRFFDYFETTLANCCVPKLLKIALLTLCFY